jgi:DNA-binding beta-propeller fold protein YncE
LHSGGDNAVAVDPTNRLVYVGESDALPSATQTAGLRVRSITATDVPEITGSPYPIQGTGPTSILPTADGNYVYVANRSVSGISTGNIAGFSVTSTALTSLGAAVAAGPAGQIGLAEDSTASYVLAVDSAGDPDLQVYTLSSGTLTSLLTAATGTGNVDPIAIAAVP